MSAFSDQQVEELAPDAASVKAGRGLAKTSKWPLLGANGSATWGECKGSGKNPYRVRVDLQNFASKCSCPSRKFPCKHALGLLFLQASSEKSFKDTDPPEWVAEWLDARQNRLEKKEQRKKEAKPVDEKAQKKRQEKREDKVLSGIDELDLWLQDLVRSGLGSLAARPYEYWEKMAARMVDAQASGLAARVRKISDTASRGIAASEDLTVQVGQLYLLLQAYRNQRHLDDDLRDEVRSLVGWNLTKDEVLGGSSVSDEWICWGRTVEEIDTKLRSQKLWLQRVRDGEWVMGLSFSYGGAPFDMNLLPGNIYNSKVYYYPGLSPKRILAEEASESRELNQGDIQFSSDFQQAMERFASGRAIDPFLQEVPVLLNEAVFSIQEESYYLSDGKGVYVPLHVREDYFWECMAKTGGHPTLVFGLWNGRVFNVLFVHEPVDEGKRK